MSLNTSLPEIDSESTSNRRTCACPFCDGLARETRDGTQVICGRCARHYDVGEIESLD
jgi:hypothetical protein